MKCLKCEQEMKQYVGLVETGWDCVNPNCGKNASYTVKELPGTTPNTPPVLAVDDCSEDFVYVNGYVMGEAFRLPITFIPPGPVNSKEMSDALNKLVKDLWDSFQLPHNFSWLDTSMTGLSAQLEASEKEQEGHSLDVRQYNPFRMPNETDKEFADRIQRRSNEIL